MMFMDWEMHEDAGGIRLTKRLMEYPNKYIHIKKATMDNHFGFICMFARLPELASVYKSIYNDTFLETFGAPTFSLYQYDNSELTMKHIDDFLNRVEGLKAFL